MKCARGHIDRTMILAVSVCVCARTYTHVYTCTYNTCTHMHTVHPHMCTHNMRTHMYTHLHTHAHTHNTCTNIYTYSHRSNTANGPYPSPRFVVFAHLIADTLFYRVHFLDPWETKHGYCSHFLWSVFPRRKGRLQSTLPWIPASASVVWKYFLYHLHTSFVNDGMVSLHSQCPAGNHYSYQNAVCLRCKVLVPS